MSGSRPNRTVPARSTGFTPIHDPIVQELGLVAAAVYGAAWRYCQLSDHVCRASLRTIGERLGLNESTVLKYLKKLVAEGYLVDTTPEARNVPHVYKDTGKARREPAVSGHAGRKTVCDTNTVFDRQTDNSATVCDDQLKKQEGKETTRRQTASKEATSRKATEMPECCLFREVTGHFPRKDQFGLVEQAIQQIAARLGRQPSAADLRPYYEPVLVRDYKRGTIYWLTEWAVNGAVPQKGQKDAHANSRNQASARAEQPTADQLAAYRSISADNARRRTRPGVSPVR